VPRSCMTEMAKVDSWTDLARRLPACSRLISGGGQRLVRESTSGRGKV
jgi:hypothetical protein